MNNNKIFDALPEELKPILHFNTYEQLVVIGDFLRYISTNNESADMDSLCIFFWTDILQKSKLLFTYKFPFLFTITEYLKSRKIDTDRIYFNSYLNIYKSI